MPSTEVLSNELLKVLESKVGAEGGLEPPRYCYRQPLKLVEIAC